MIIVIVCRQDTKGYPTETYKGTGGGGSGKNIGTGMATRIAGDMVMTVEDMMVMAAEIMVTGTTADTPIGIK